MSTILPPSVQKQYIPRGARVLVRASLNVPIKDGKVVGMFRLEETLRTINFLRERKARITVIGHLGREGASLAPVHKVLNESLPVSFLPRVVGKEVYAARDRLQAGEILLLENTRTDPREMENDAIFAEELGVNTDLFVFDDFSAAHREHSSTSGLVHLLPSCVGIRFYQELTALLRVTERVVNPAIAILGGAKCETKIPLIKELMKTYDTVFVGGVIANTILKQKGHNVGASTVEDVSLPDEVLHSEKVIVPRDVVVTKDLRETRTVQIDFIENDDIIVDVGDGFLKILFYHLEKAKTVLCNGPLGWYEKGFSGATAKLSSLVSDTETYSFVGGGDIVSLLEQQNLLNDWGFVSTGGGALLTHVTGTLSVLRAFEEKMKSDTTKNQND